MLVVSFKKVNSNDHKATINFVHPFRDYVFYMYFIGFTSRNDGGDFAVLRLRCAQPTNRLK